MSLDTTEIGVVAACVMADLEDDERTGRLGADARVVAAMTVYEIAYTDAEGDTASAVGLRVTDDRNVLALGLTARAYQALIDPDQDG